MNLSEKFTGVKIHLIQIIGCVVSLFIFTPLSYELIINLYDDVQSGMNYDLSELSFMILPVMICIVSSFLLMQNLKFLKIKY